MLYLLPLYYLLIGLWHGGRFDHIYRCKLCANILWGLGFVCFVYATTHSVFLAIFAGVLSAVGKALGHGQYMYITDRPEYVAPERVDFIVRLVFGKETNPDYVARNVFGLTVVGLTAVSGALLVLPHAPISVSLLLAAGALKGPIYLFCKKLFKTTRFPISEALTGFVVGLTLSLVI